MLVQLPITNGCCMTTVVLGRRDASTFGAKSVCWLQQALSVAELYGVLDTDTRDWTDGLLSNIFRDINKPLPPGKVHYLPATSTACLHTISTLVIQRLPSL